VLLQDHPGANVIDEGPVATQGEPVLADEIGEDMKPPRRAGSHQHNLYPGTLGGNQRRPRPQRARTVAAQQGPVEVRSHQPNQTGSRHHQATPLLPGKNLERLVDRIDLIVTLARTPAPARVRFAYARCVLILLPPSETKTGRVRGRPADPGLVSFPELTSTRIAVAQALAVVSARPDAPALLGVSANLRADIAHNVRLDSAPAVQVANLYTGVLYDALGLPSMDSAARRRANRWLVIISALYGALRPRDKIPPYRLSMGVNLGALGPLASTWRTPLAGVLPIAAGRGVIVDCRSSTYAAAWTPQGELAARWVQVRVPGATHQAKHTRGLVARHLCEQGADARTARSLQRIVAQRFETTLTKPTRTGQPWILDTVSAPLRH
jgi:cytoplasmic iron level regulating protein YaaA (DUF328/UPF0246 family)